MEMKFLVYLYYLSYRWTDLFPSSLITDCQVNLNKFIPILATVMYKYRKYIYKLFAFKETVYFLFP